MRQTCIRLNLINILHTKEKIKETNSLATTGCKKQALINEVEINGFNREKDFSTHNYGHIISSPERASHGKKGEGGKAVFQVKKN